VTASFAREGDEERVSLSVDLAAAGLREGGSQQLLVIGKHGPVPVAEGLEQDGRALDVREEEGDRPGWELSHSVTSDRAWSKVLRRTVTVDTNRCSSDGRG
jgi:hypothetical protein